MHLGHHAFFFGVNLSVFFRDLLFISNPYCFKEKKSKNTDFQHRTSGFAKRRHSEYLPEKETKRRGCTKEVLVARNNKP